MNRYDYILKIPPKTFRRIENYLYHAIPPGPFLHYFMKNDLQGTVVHATPEELNALRAIYEWLYYEAPTIAFRDWSSKTADHRRNIMHRARHPEAQQAALKYLSVIESHRDDAD